MYRILYVILGIVIVTAIIWGVTSTNRLEEAEHGSGTPVTESESGAQSTGTQFVSPGAEYTVTIPHGWYAHEAEDMVVITTEESLDLPRQTEGYALGVHMTMRVINVTDEGVANIDAWMVAPEFIEGGDGTLMQEDVDRNTFPFTRIVRDAAGADGQVLMYVYRIDDTRAIVLTQYPFAADSDATQTFEYMVASFNPIIGK